eukprot:scaffold20150_cov42-Attheya_sp.AAC.2
MDRNSLLLYVTSTETICQKLGRLGKAFQKEVRLSDDLSKATIDAFKLVLQQVESDPKPSGESKHSAAEFQKNASNRQLLEPIDDLGETVAQAAVAAAPPNPMPLPPLVAPAQAAYVVMDAGDTNVAAVQHHLGVRALQKTALGKDGITVY